MQDDSETAPGAARDERIRDNVAGESLLRSEVAFWRDMIESCAPDHPPESLERMQQALGLAEFRLSQLHRAGRSG